MKTVIVPAPGKIEIRQVETPVINAYQALVKTEMVALCNATDSKLVAGKFPGVDTYPLALGHENAGIVVAVGEKVRNFKMGDRVAVLFPILAHRVSIAAGAVSANM